MTIYSSAISSLTAADLGELLTEQAQEGLRLEFKLLSPSRDEALKKISSFANTFGGYLLIGAQADSATGRLISLPGVQPQPGLKQQLITWASEQLSPPATIYVSDPITIDQATGTVCYLVHVPISNQGPHFLNGRKGVYVRTDEYSTKFEPQLATFSEIQYLGGKRGGSVQRREELVAASRRRFQHYLSTDYPKDAPEGKLGPLMSLSVSVEFPTNPLAAEAALLKLILPGTIRWRQMGFPGHGIQVTQHETAVLLRPAVGFSYLEASSWGHMFYALELDRQMRDVRGIHLPAFIGHLLVFLAHAGESLGKVGYDGPLTLLLDLQGIREQPLIWFSQGSFPEQSGGSPLDDSLQLSMQLETTGLASPASRQSLCATLLQRVLFALNWHQGAIEPTWLHGLLDQGIRYNNWEV